METDSISQKISEENKRIDKLNLKLDILEEQVIDTLIACLTDPTTITREEIQACGTATAVLKANKRCLQEKLPNPRGNPLDDIEVDADDLPTNFLGSRK